MSSFFWLSADARPAERAAFSSLDATLALEGEMIDDGKISHLVRTKLDGRRYYVKVYHLAGRNLRRYMGRSRVRSEWHNQMLFGSFGVPSARIVAFGERGRWFSARDGVIVTEEVPETLPGRGWLNDVIDRLARHVRSMHSHRFVHNDLKWRNILVDFSKSPEVYIIDCPRGGRTYGPLLARGIAKDLACLDRVAKRHLSRTERLRFFKRYHDVDVLTEAHKRQIMRVLRFFEGRE
jgi:tRNA A-37 threonylcarbamoyl transferase component Bud32